MDKPLSQRDLARIAGVSPMTVSLALRGHTSISAATRERIRKLAEKHNYRPDPALAALNAYRLRNTERRYQGTLAWITRFPTADGWREMIHAESYFNGAARRAEELGYQLENFWLDEPGLRPARATQILLARGVKGIIAAPLSVASGTMELGWKHFPCITLGYSLREPRLNVVMNHQSRNMKQLVHRLHQTGYRRIGLAMPSANNERVDQNYLGGYLISQRETGGPILEPLLADDFCLPVFRKWLRKQKPDCVVISPVWHDEVKAWLQAENLAVPSDIGLAAPSVTSDSRHLSGIDENPSLIGAVAVNALVGMIHNRESGIPDQPWSLLTEGIWHEGDSTLKAPAPPRQGPDGNLDGKDRRRRK
ncbi:MAG: LacI family DNA-binding transcriptional regulator [Akkermansiaceae bacterium]|nr:LacI family DNA-binding transcriptional regulator [Akkermansiaceae bacterium]